MGEAIQALQLEVFQNIKTSTLYSYLIKKSFSLFSSPTTPLCTLLGFPDTSQHYPLTKVWVIFFDS